MSVKYQGERDVIRHKDGEDHKRWEKSFTELALNVIATFAKGCGLVRLDQTF